MLDKNYFRPLFTFFLFAVCAFSISAQPARQNFNRARTYDVQHYTIRVSFDRADKTIIGDTIVRLKPLQNNFNKIELDAANLKFDSVKLESGNKEIARKTKSP